MSFRIYHGFQNSLVIFDKYFSPPKKLRSKHYEKCFIRFSLFGIEQTLNYGLIFKIKNLSCVKKNGFVLNYNNFNV